MSKIKVAVRVRPLSKKEVDDNSKFIVDIKGDTISVTNIKVDSHSEFGDSRERVKHFSYDYCYDSAANPQSTAHASQELVFQDLGTDVLQAAFEGYNTCVLAYGQTSTGKTYTMMGNHDDPGLTPRICEGLFSHIDDIVGEKVRVDISYFEIYNERVRDLLRPSLRKQNEKYTLKVREHPKEGPYVQDLSSHCVRDNQQIQELLDRGQENRTTASTYMHDYSSRSHSIVTVKFTQAKLEDDLPHEIVSKIHLVDLAGSERADPSWSSDYKGRLKEGSNINRSLVTLGNVIKSLAERSLLSWSTDNLGSTQSIQSSSGTEGRASPTVSPKRRVPYIPYRDSVLTWLLKDSLGGNSKTIMIATVTPASAYYNETLSTLRYAQRAKRIVNKPMINEDPNVALIRELRREIEKLRLMLASAAQMDIQYNDVMYVIPPLQTHHREIDIKGSPLVAVQDSGTFIAEKLRENEDMANKLTQTWKDKWQEAHDIIKESDLSIRGLSKRASSMGILIESQLPHLVGMDDDILSTGVLIYHLKEGKTLIGREDAVRDQDIVISGPSVQREHCFIKNILGTVTLYVNRGAQVTINGIDCKEPTRLKQGDYILLGRTNMFRFNNPAEAAKLRERRESQEGLLSSASSFSSINTEDDNLFLRVPRLVPPISRNQQLERQFSSEAERIEEARRELEALNQDQDQTEDQRNESEEALWLAHETKRADIEDHKLVLTKLVEEVQIQKQQAEDEINFKRECLEKEKEAFQEYLQKELAKLREKEQNSELFRQTESDVFVIEPPGDQNPEISQEQVTQAIRKRKLSVEGHIKDLSQDELLKRLDYRRLEQDVVRHEEEIEDQLEQSQIEVDAQILKLKALQDKYDAEDALYYTSITDKGKHLEEIQERKEQLELYIEEKQNLLSVQADRPHPLRTACSEEVLTDAQFLGAGFPLRVNSLKTLQRGSEGDLPSISQRFSMASGLNSGITPEETLLSCSVPMSIGAEDLEGAENMEMDEEQLSESSSDLTGSQKRTAKSAKISDAAKRVTDRLYTPPPPKFKREAKEKKPTPPKASKGKKDDKKDGSSDERSRRSVTPRKSPLREKTPNEEERSRRSVTPRKSPLREQTSTVKKSAAKKSPEPTSKASTPKTTTDKQKSTKTSPHAKSSPNSSSPSGAADTKKSATGQKPRSSVTLSPVHMSRSVTPPGLGHDDQFSVSLGRGMNKMAATSSPDLRLLNRSPSPEKTGKILVSRMPATKLRHMASTPSLASVPEAVGEEGDVMEASTLDKSFPQVVRRPNRRHIEGEQYKRHSAPVGENLFDLFQRFTSAMGDLRSEQHSETADVDNSESKDSLELSIDTAVPENTKTLHTSNPDDMKRCSGNENIHDIDKTTGKNLPDVDMTITDIAQAGHPVTMETENGAMEVDGFPVTVEGECGAMDIEDVSLECSDLSRNETLNDSDLICVTPTAISNNTSADINESEYINTQVEFDEPDGEFNTVLKTNELELKINLRRNLNWNRSDSSGDTSKNLVPRSDNKDGISGTNNVVNIDSVIGVDSSSINFDEDMDSINTASNSLPLRTGSKRDHDVGQDSSDIATKYRKGDENEKDGEPRHSSGDASSVSIIGPCEETVLTTEQEGIVQVPVSHHIEFVESSDFGHSQGILHGVSSTEDIIICEDIENVIPETNAQSVEENGEEDDRFSSDSLDSGSERQPKVNRDENLSCDSLDGSPESSDVMAGNGKNILKDGNVSDSELSVMTDKSTHASEIKEHREMEINPSESRSLVSDQENKAKRVEIKVDLKSEVIEEKPGQESSISKQSPVTQGPKSRKLDQVQDNIASSENNCLNDSEVKSDIANEIYEESRRTLGTCTSPDFVFLEPGINVAEEGLCSDDSLQEVQEQLQVLQEALDQKSPRGSNGNNTQLSSARKAVRQRAVIRQKQRGCGEESDDIDHPSDDSVPSETQQKSSSRPQSGSRRRRRINNNKSDKKAKQLKGLSSEEYITSESDEIYSDDSLTGQVEFSLSDGVSSDQAGTELLDANSVTQIGPNFETGDADAGNNLSELSDTETKITVDFTGCFLTERQNMDQRNVNGFVEAGDRNIEDKESHSRSSSETRSVQTDISLLGNGHFIKPLSDGTYSELAVSPLSIWSSGEKNTQYHQPHSKGGAKTKPEKSIKKHKHVKQENLVCTATDHWSAEELLPYSSRKRSASRSKSDPPYSMETETLSPQLPSPSDRFVQGSPNGARNVSALSMTFPVVYEITVQEENTNVFYNVEKTEIKTYGLRSMVDSGNIPTVPDSININLQETNTNRTEKKSETIHKEEVYFHNLDQQASPTDSVISERTFESVSDISVENRGTSEEKRMEQKNVVEDSENYIQSDYTVSVQSPQEQNIKADSLQSPRESDTTSDYGTLVEKLGTSSCLSGSQSTIPGDLEYSPFDDAVFHKGSDDAEENTEEGAFDYRLGVSNIPDSVEENLNPINVEGHQLCKTADINTTSVRPGVSHISRSPEFVSNVIQDTVDDVVQDPGVDLKPNYLTKDMQNRSTSPSEGAKSNNSKEVFEEFNQPENELQQQFVSSSNDSMDYSTPTQFLSQETIESVQEMDVSNSNVQNADQLTQGSVNESVNQNISVMKPTMSLLSPQRSLKTVSVNTDHGEQQSLKPPTTDERSFREDLKRELQQKLDHLQHRVRSLSDSAISSDFTDGDSTSASPRGSRLCESDKVLKTSIGLGGSSEMKITPPTDVIVRTTQPGSLYEQPETSPFVSATAKSLDIDKKTVKKSPFQDSGNVFDEELTETEEPLVRADEINEIEIELARFKAQKDASFKAEGEDEMGYPVDVEVSEQSASGSEDMEQEERSLSPGEIWLKPHVFTSNELYQTFASGLMSMDGMGATENQTGDELRNVNHRHLSYKEKSPSLSDLTARKETEDYHRSLSENCIDQYEEKTNSSNESIVFVFMGQSHTNESMEELKNYTSSQSEYKLHEEEDDKDENEATVIADEAVDMQDDNGNEIPADISPEQHNRNRAVTRSVSESEDTEEAPLRHRYGIDSNVLPIPERSISSDNLLKACKDVPSIHRSRSADMLDVGVIEDPTGNDGVFPPCPNTSSEDNDTSNNSVKFRTLSENSSFIDEKPENMSGAAQDMMYASLESPQYLDMVKPGDVEYEGQISDTEILTLRKPFYGTDIAERGVTTGRDQLSHLVSIGVQACLSDSSTQTDTSYSSSSELASIQNVLPPLGSDLRSQSWTSMNSESGPTKLNLTEETEEWYNLSHMVLENKTILKNIEKNVPGVPLEKDGNNSETKEMAVGSPHENMSTQTSASLTNLQNSGIQTDESFDVEDRKHESCASTTQTGSGLVSLLELTDVESIDYIPEEPTKTGHDTAVQTFEFPVSATTKSREMSAQTDMVGPYESETKPVHTQPTFADTLNNHSGVSENTCRKTTTEIKQENQQNWHSEIEVKAPEEITTTETIESVEQVPSYTEERIQESQKRRASSSNQSDNQIVVTEREYRMSTEVELPDLETSNAEIEALKQEHSKMMETLKKAAENRKERVEISKLNKKSMSREELDTIKKEIEQEMVVESFSRPLSKEEIEMLMRRPSREEDSHKVQERMVESSVGERSSTADSVSKNKSQTDVVDEWTTKSETVSDRTSRANFEQTRITGVVNERRSQTDTVSEGPSSENKNYRENIGRFRSPIEIKSETHYEKSVEKETENRSEENDHVNIRETKVERIYSGVDKTKENVDRDKTGVDRVKKAVDGVKDNVDGVEDEEFSNLPIGTKISYKVVYEENIIYSSSDEEKSQEGSETEMEKCDVDTRDTEIITQQNSTDELLSGSGNKEMKEDGYVILMKNLVPKEDHIYPTFKERYSLNQTFPAEKVETKDDIQPPTYDTSSLEINPPNEEIILPSFKQRYSYGASEMVKAADENDEVKSRKPLSDGAILNQKIKSHFVEDDYRARIAASRKPQTYYKYERTEIDENVMPVYGEEVDDVLSDTIGSPTCGTPPNSPLASNDDVVQTFDAYDIALQNTDYISNEKTVKDLSDVPDGDVYETMYSDSIIPKRNSGITQKDSDTDTINSIKLYTPKKKKTEKMMGVLSTELREQSPSGSFRNSSVLAIPKTSSDISASTSNVMPSKYAVDQATSNITTADTKYPDTSTYISSTYSRKSSSSSREDKSNVSADKNTPENVGPSRLDKNGNRIPSTSSGSSMTVDSGAEREIIKRSKNTTLSTSTSTGDNAMRSYITHELLKGNRVNTGVEVCVSSSDDFTQTDLGLDLSALTNENLSRDTANNEKIKKDLERLHKERVEIIELLSLNYLPSSLTIELLERKLNYCIGQTDLLLENVGDNLDVEIEELNIRTTHHNTREYISKYKEDLQQSKRDIEICKERMDRQRGSGRGRTIGRNRDLFRMRRNAEIEVFKTERSIEQLKYDRDKTVNPLKNLSASIHERYDIPPRCVSPASSTCSSTRSMRPKQHRDHLVELRKQLVKATKEEDFRMRNCRSSSPRLVHTERSRYPSSSYRYRTTRDRSVPLYPHQEAPIDYKTDVSYGVSPYLSPPSYDESIYDRRSHSYNVERYDRSSSPYDVYSANSSRYHSADSSRIPSYQSYDRVGSSRDNSPKSEFRTSSPRDISHRYHSVETTHRTDRPQLYSLRPSSTTRHHSLETRYQISGTNQETRTHSVDRYGKFDGASNRYSVSSSRDGSPHSIYTTSGAKLHSALSRENSPSKVMSEQPSYSDSSSFQTEDWCDDETRTLLKEIEEMKKENRQEILRAKDTLSTYQRGASKDSHTEKNIDKFRQSSNKQDQSTRTSKSYSSYTDYATDILNTSQQSLGSLSGTYELYDGDNSRNITGRLSPTSSLMSEDLESLPDSVHSGNIHTYSQTSENKFKSTRPVRSSDLKSKLFRRKKLW